MRRMRTTAALGVVLALALAGCTATTTTTGAGSRAELYDSLEALAADSAVAVVGTVVAVEPEAGDDTVVATVDVESTPYTPRLAETFDGDAPPIAEGDAVGVRQYASQTARLEPGRQYLLYLVPTGLGDGLWYVSGATAGVWERDGDVFVRVDPESGDDLPATFDLAD